MADAAAVAGVGGGMGRGAGAAAIARPDPLPPFYDPKLSLDKRLDNLMSQLALEEKVSLMGMDSRAIPRLGIASYRWWNEALHGVNAANMTTFPQSIGLGAMWDVNLQHELATVIGVEGRARHAASGTGLDYWAPNINLCRDPRWGRAQETYGEDPYLTGRLAVAFVTGMQGDDPFYFRTISTPKHFAVHSGPEPDRHSINMDITDQDLFTSYLPNFEAAVREGHCFSIMSAYSALDGIPCPASKRLLTDILRDQWGFKGVVVSDVDAIGDIWRGTSHNYTTSNVLASALAIKAGNDLCGGTTYYGGNGGSQGGPIEPGPSAVARAVTQNAITEKDVDLCLRRILEARFRMGEFDPPGYEGNPFNKITADMQDTEEHNAVARKVADECMVLLKNANHTLPLKTTIRTLAVMGPNANALRTQYGNYAGTPSQRHQISIIDGIRQVVGADHVLTTTDLQVPIAGNIALTESIKADYLYTDASKRDHGLTLGYSTPQGAGGGGRSPDGSIKPPEQAAGNVFDARMTGVLVPPATGEYTIGGKGRDAFRISIDGNVVVDQMRGGPMRTASACISLQKDKAYNVLVEFSHTSTTGTTASWYGAPVPPAWHPSVVQGATICRQPQGAAKACAAAQVVAVGGVAGADAAADKLTALPPKPPVS